MVVTKLASHHVRVRGETRLWCKSFTSKNTLSPNANPKRHAPADATLYALHLTQKMNIRARSEATWSPTHHPLNPPGGHFSRIKIQKNSTDHRKKKMVSVKSNHLSSFRATLHYSSRARPS